MSDAILSVERDIYDSEKNRVGYSQATLFPGASAWLASYASIIRNHVPPHAAAEEPFWSEEKPCIGLIVGAAGANPINKGGFGGNFAIRAEDGMFAGLRPQTRVINAAGTYDLSRYDHTIIISYSTSGSLVTLNLPSQPQDGQCYKIISTDNEHDITIQGNGYNIYNMETGTKQTSFLFSAAHRRIIELVWDGREPEWILYFYYMS